MGIGSPEALDSFERGDLLKLLVIRLGWRWFTGGARRMPEAISVLQAVLLPAHCLFCQPQKIFNIEIVFEWRE